MIPAEDCPSFIHSLQVAHAKLQDAFQLTAQLYLNPSVRRRPRALLQAQSFFKRRQHEHQFKKITSFHLAREGGEYKKKEEGNETPRGTLAVVAVARSYRTRRVFQPSTHASLAGNRQTDGAQLGHVSGGGG